MKRAALMALALAAAQPALAGEEPLRPGKPAEVYVAPGRATTVLLRTGQKVAAISLASPVVSYKYDKALNQLEITPTVRSGGVETNLNLRIGDEVYVLVVKVVSDVRAQFLRVFSVEGDPGPDDETGLLRARPLKPSEVDIVGAARAFERGEVDPVFREARPGLRIEGSVGKYAWNGCTLALDLAQFLDLDLLLFRVRWLNRTAEGIYLDPGQYGLMANGVKIPITARYAESEGAIVLPGQLETVYLAVQGYRLSRHNRWGLALPPDSAAVDRLLGGRGLP